MGLMDGGDDDHVETPVHEQLDVLWSELSRQDHDELHVPWRTRGG